MDILEENEVDISGATLDAFDAGVEANRVNVDAKTEVAGDTKV